MDEAREQRILKRVLGARVFVNAPRCRELLEILCEARWAGEGDSLTQYDLAEFLYGSVGEPELARARRMAGEVRRRLALHYAGEGAEDPVHIELPKGAYEIRFGDVVDGDSTEASESEPAVLVSGWIERRRAGEIGFLFLSLLLLVLVFLAGTFLTLPGGRSGGNDSASAVDPSDDQVPHSVEVEGENLYVLNARKERIARHTEEGPLHPYEADALRRHIDREDYDGLGLPDLAVLTRGHEGDPPPTVHILRGEDLRWLAHVPLAPLLEGAAIPHTTRFGSRMVRFLHDDAGRPHSILAAGTSLDGSLGYFFRLGLNGLERDVLWTWGHPTPGFDEVDIDGDGRLEVLVGTRHDGLRGSGTALVVLDGENVRGFAPHPPGSDYFPPDASSEGLIAYVLFPPSPLTAPTYKNYVNEISVFEEREMIKISIIEGVGTDHEVALWYWLNFDLRVLWVQMTDNYKKACREIGCPYDKAGEQELARRVERLR